MLKFVHVGGPISFSVTDEVRNGVGSVALGALPSAALCLLPRTPRHEKEAERLGEPPISLNTAMLSALEPLCDSQFLVRSNNQALISDSP